MIEFMTLLTRLALTISVIVFLPLATLASPPYGLETETPRQVALLIEVLNEDAQRIGLSQTLIHAHILLRLHAQGVQVKAYDSHADGPFMYVNFNVQGAAFNINVEFCRPVYYRVYGVQVDTLAPTWKSGITGQHAGSDTAQREFIMGSLDDVLKDFMADFFTVHDRPALDVGSVRR